MKPNERLLKKLDARVGELIKQHPTKTIEVWAEDEARIAREVLSYEQEGRIGLKPVTRRIWAKRGNCPIVVQKRGFKWLHVYAFVHPKTGSSAFWIISHVDLVCMEVALREFKQEIDPENQKVIVLLLDNAGWQSSKNLLVPEGVILEFIPAYTPELSPAEGAMPLLHEAVANECFECLDEVERVLDDRCVFLRGNP